MKRILGFLAAVAALLAVIWVILESREGRYSSSYASHPETPAPQQFAGGSFTYSFVAASRYILSAAAAEADWGRGVIFLSSSIALRSEITSMARSARRAWATS